MAAQTVTKVPYVDNETVIGAANLNAIQDAVNNHASLIDGLDSNKVDKVVGKGLSTNDYNNDAQSKLNNLPSGPELDTSLGGKVDKRTSGTEVYTHNGATQGGVVLTETPTAGAVPLYGTGGVLKAGAPVAANDVVRKAELDEVVDELSDSTTGLGSKAPAIIETVGPAAIASFDDGADGMPVKKLVANIEPVQDLHGYDHPWPAGGGDNIHPESSIGGTSNGVTVVQNAGDYSLSGTASGYAQFVSTETFTLPAGTYTLKEFNWASGIYFQLRSEDGQTIYASTASGESNTFTLASEVTVKARIIVSENVATNRTIQIEIVSGSTAPSAYSPYSNICPISGHTGAEIEQAGANVADKSKFSIERPDWFPGAYWLGLTENADGTYTLTRPIGWGGYGMVYLGTFNPGTYTVSFDAISTANVRCTGALSVKKTETWISNVEVRSLAVEAIGRSSFATFTTTEKCDFWLSVGPFTDNGAQVISGNYQVEIGTVSHEFSEYTGNQISVTFPETIYGGEDEVISGKLKSTMGIVDLGALNWTYASSGERSLFTSYDLANRYKTSGGSSIPVNAMFECYLNVAMNSTFKNGEAGLDGNISSRIVVCDNRYTDADSFKAAMSGIHLCYELAEPVEYTLTENEVETLYGTNNIWADTGDVTADYPADTKLYIDNHITQAIANALNA